MKSKSLRKNLSLKLKAYRGFESCAAGFLLLIFSFSAPVSKAQISQKLDPTNLLASDLNQTAQQAGKINTPLQPAAKPSSIPEPSYIIDNTPLNFASQIGQQLSRTEHGKTNTRHNMKQKILKTDMIALKNNDNKQKTELQEIIEQINSIEFKPGEKKVDPVIIIEPTVFPESDEISTDIEDTSATSQPIQKQETDKILLRLRELSKKPEKQQNPLKLAEILFLGDYLNEAAIFYQEALKQTGTDDPKSIQDRAWILFQIGNCLKTEEPKTAMKMYRQLITEHPDSPWTNLAKTQDKLTDWYQTDKPEELINKNYSGLN